MASDIPGSAVPVSGCYVIDPHHPSDPMLAAGLARFAQIEKDPRGSVDPMACGAGCEDQRQQPLIFPCQIEERIPQPGIEPAARHVEEAAHHGRIKLSTMGFNGSVLYSDILRSVPIFHVPPLF